MVPTTSCPKSLSYLTRCPANPTTFPRKPIPFPRAAVCFPLRAAQNLPLFHHLHLKPIHFPTICLTGSTPFPPPASQSDMCLPPHHLCKNPKRLCASSGLSFIYQYHQFTKSNISLCIATDMYLHLCKVFFHDN
jgi:hypothetical protein